MSKERTFWIVLLLWTLNATARIVFGIMTITQGSLLDVEVALIAEQTITVMFLTLGLFGFLAVPGLLQKKRWGFLMALAVSLATVVFDIWGFTIQFTAAMGFIMPAVMLVYLGKNKLISKEVER
ncbi:MAG: hypothetical protein ACTSSD_19490 [Candidatus Thorarchaeota archaeon]